MKDLFKFEELFWDYVYT